jgi:hypothetical protein
MAGKKREKRLLSGFVVREGTFCKTEVPFLNSEMGLGISYWLWPLSGIPACCEEGR